MRTISLLAIAMLTLTIFGSSPKPVHPKEDALITLVKTNTELIKLNNEYIKDTRIIPMEVQDSLIDSTYRGFVNENDELAFGK